MNYRLASAVFSVCAWVCSIGTYRAADVQMTEDTGSVTLANADVALRIEKTSARLQQWLADKSWQRVLLDKRRSE
jgi:hypothetical protein